MHVKDFSGKFTNATLLGYENSTILLDLFFNFFHSPNNFRISGLMSLSYESLIPQ